MRILISLFLLLCLVACENKKEKYQEEVDAAWNLLEQTKPAKMEDQIVTYKGFLEKYPADHEHGNKWAKEAKTLIKDLESLLAARASAKVERERQDKELAEHSKALRPIVEQELFKLAGWAMGGSADAPIVKLVHKEKHQLSRAHFRGSNWAVLRDLPLDKIRSIIGSAIYDDKEKKYDYKALEKLLSSSFIEPETDILGTTAKKLFPAFRDRLRLELKLYVGLHATFFGRLDEIEEELAMLSDDDTAGAWNLVWSDGHEDRRRFYAYLVHKYDAVGHCGVNPDEVDHLDVGFWIRRIEDGTASILADHLRRILGAYDAKWLGGIDAEMKKWVKTPYRPTKAYLEDGTPVLFKRLVPMLYGGHRYAIEQDGKERTLAEGEMIWFTKPLQAAPFRANKDLLLQPPKTAAGSHLFFRTGGSIVFDNEKMRFFDASHKEERSVDLPLSRPLAEVYGSGDGSLFALTERTERNEIPRSWLVDANGKEVEKLERFGVLAVNENGSILVGREKDSKELVVRFRTITSSTTVTSTGAKMPETVRIKTEPKIALHPTLPLLVAGDYKKTELFDLTTGARVLTTREGEYVLQRSFDPTGQLLFSGQGERAVIEHFDAQKKTFASAIFLAVAYPRGHWMRGDRILLLSEGFARVVDIAKNATVGREVRCDRVEAVSLDGKTIVLQVGADWLFWSIDG